MSKDLTDVAVGTLVAFIAVVGGVRRRVGHLHLCGTVLCVMEVEAITDVAEQPRGRLLLHGFLVETAKKMKTTEYLAVRNRQMLDNHLILINLSN